MTYSLHELLLLFFIYAFLGWCAEVCYAALRSGGFVNRGFLNGPICPIYGVGMVIVILCLTPIEGSLPGLFLGSLLLTSALEYATGLALEKLFHLKWWDYSDRKWNLRGYVCLEFSIMWGVGGTVIMKLIHPPIYALVQVLPGWAAWLIGGILLAVLAVDLAATLAQIRQLQKRLAAIDELAANIHSVSDAMAEGLYEGVQAALEKSRQYQQELEEKQAELEAKKAEFEEKKAEFEEKKAAVLESMEDRRRQAEQEYARRQAEVEAAGKRLAELLAEHKLQLAESVEDRREQAQQLKEELEAQLREALESARRPDRRLLRAFPALRSTTKVSPAISQLREALARRKEQRKNGRR